MAQNDEREFKLIDTKKIYTPDDMAKMSFKELLELCTWLDRINHLQTMGLLDKDEEILKLRRQSVFSSLQRWHPNAIQEGPPPQQQIPVRVRTEVVPQAELSDD